MTTEQKLDLVSMARGYLGLVAIWALKLSPYITLQ